MSRIKKAKGLEKARKVKHTNYIRRQLERLERKCIPVEGKTSITKKEIYNRIKAAAEDEMISFAKALKGIEATRAFTSAEQNFKIQVNSRLNIADRNRIRSVIATKTGQAYKTVQLNILDGNWVYDSSFGSSGAIIDSTRSVAIWLTHHNTGESSYVDFVAWEAI